MAMSTGGGKGGVSSEINMTPMIDILLVLLIIFMVVQEGAQEGMSVQVPPLESTSSANQSVDQIVLEVLRGDEFLLNSNPVSRADLRSTLFRTYENRARKVIFIEGAEDATYGEVAFAVDQARLAGIEIVGLVPREEEAAAGN